MAGKQWKKYDKEKHIWRFDPAFHGNLPERFTFPFYYTPDKAALRAAEHLMDLLDENTWNHNFGLGDNEALAIGKMFGVLVVKDDDGRLGYLCAFSGKLADANDHEGFVPPIYDLLVDEGYYKREEANLNNLNDQVKALESNPYYLNAKEKLNKAQRKAEKELSEFRKIIKSEKSRRKSIRASLDEHHNEDTKGEVLEQLRKESVGYSLAYKNLLKKKREYIKELEVELKEYQDRIDELNRTKKEKSSRLQEWIFRQYQFLNAHGERKDLLDLFKDTAIRVPPSGAGECAAPKLLNFCFDKGYQPVSMAEFWWGRSPKESIRQHRNFYPSCQGRCGPILGHMLKGTNMDPDPINKQTDEIHEIEVIYEDDAVIIVDKPSGLLSVPGKTIKNSVYSQLRKKYPDAEDPILVHRLDMSTSGILLCAKKRPVHGKLQQQFIKRGIEKKYLAVLEGKLEKESGVINLPMSLDYLDRPRQKVDFNQGKKAVTHFNLLGIEGNRSYVLLKPITGRTHQLRVHSAHHRGLGVPIVGDDLYGHKDERLMLHAYEIKFYHPALQKDIQITRDPEFYFPFQVPT